MRVERLLLLSLIGLFTLTYKGKSQPFYQIQKLNYSFLYEGAPDKVRDQKDIERFKINFIGAKERGNETSYPLIPPANMKYDSLELISELLTFQGDTRTCGLGITKYNLKLSYDIDYSKYKYYSIQLDALLLINQIIYKEDWIWYSPFPMLKNVATGEMEAVDGEVIDKAYKYYNAWFKRAERIGLEEARKPENHPLKESGIEWF